MVKVDPAIHTPVLDPGQQGPQIRSIPNPSSGMPV